MSIQKNKVEKVPSDVASDNKEVDRLRRDMHRPDMEKLQLFTQMLRVNAVLKRAIVTHK